MKFEYLLWKLAGARMPTEEYMVKHIGLMQSFRLFFAEPIHA